MPSLSDYFLPEPQKTMGEWIPISIHADFLDFADSHSLGPDIKNANSPVHCQIARHATYTRFAVMSLEPKNSKI